MADRLLTDVPPDAHELVALGGAEIVAGNPVAFAEAIRRLLDEPIEWERRHGTALACAEQFDWSHLFGETLHRPGIR